MHTKTKRILSKAFLRKAVQSPSRSQNVLKEQIKEIGSGFVAFREHRLGEGHTHGQVLELFESLIDAKVDNSGVS